LAIVKHVSIHNSPKRFIEYILNPDSCGKATGLNIVADVDGAYEMFRQIYEKNADERFYKNEVTEGKNKIRLHHFIQSFDPKQPITPEEAHKIGVEWAKKVFGNSRQVIVSTHIEKAHIHNVRPDRAKRKAV
jgi:hypothetical protein